MTFYCRLDKENADRNAAESALNGRVDKEITDREDAINELKSRMDENNANRDAEMDDLKRKLMRENLFLKNLAGKPLSVYFDAYRTKAYDGGGEENLTFQVRIFKISKFLISKAMISIATLKLLNCLTLVSQLSIT